MTDPVLVSHALRGIRWRCRNGWHKFRPMTQHTIDGLNVKTDRCQKCGTVRRLERRV